MKLYRYFREILERRNLWDVFTYLFFGGLATVVNIVSFTLTYSTFALSWPVSNTISWILSVLFAFVTNKLWVFHSVTQTKTALLWEFTKFFAARVASYGLDMLTMWLMIDVLSSNYLAAKVVTQVLVVIVNYAFSKLFIFNKNKTDSESDKGA